MHESLNIIGAGLAGSLMSVYLAKKGYHVNVYERRPDMRKQNIGGGRSINLALSARGMKALEETDMLADIMPLALPMYGRIMHSVSGELTFQAYSHDPKECIYSVSRAELNKRLMDKAESLNRVDYHFNLRAEEVDLKTGRIRMQHAETGEEVVAEGSRTLAADGAFSGVRYAMQKLPRFNFSQDYLTHGYKELSIPPTSEGEFAMDPEALHIWPRGQYMMIALPNPDRTFTCTLFFPYEGEISFGALDTPDKVAAFFESQFADALPLMPDYLDQYATNPVGSLVTIRCWPWVLSDKIALLGDASHAIVPFFGQGMNAAFEDCTTMAACIDAHAPDWATVFDRYQHQRKANADAIADMALENYIEMRDRVADQDFLFRKAVEHQLEQQLDTYRSRYELVSFTTVPYAEAYARGEANLDLLAKLTQGLEDPTQVDIEQARVLLEG